MLVQVTVPPAEIVTGFGEYAVVVSVRAPETTVTAVPAPVGVGDVGGGVELLLPQDAANATAPTRTRIFSVLVMPGNPATPLPGAVRDFGWKSAHRRMH